MMTDKNNYLEGYGLGQNCGISVIITVGTEPLFYLTTIGCRSPPLVWAVGLVGYVNAVDFSSPSS